MGENEFNEPWETHELENLQEALIEDRNKNIIGSGYDFATPIARRIRDCINACAGMDDPEKEIARLDRLTDELEQQIAEMTHGMSQIIKKKVAQKIHDAVHRARSEENEEHRNIINGITTTLQEHAILPSAKYSCTEDIAPAVISSVGKIISEKDAEIARLKTYLKDAETRENYAHTKEICELKRRHDNAMHKVTTRLEYKIINMCKECPSMKILQSHLEKTLSLRPADGIDITEEVKQLRENNVNSANANRINVSYIDENHEMSDANVTAKCKKCGKKMVIGLNGWFTCISCGFVYYDERLFEQVITGKEISDCFTTPATKAIWQLREINEDFRADNAALRSKLEKIEWVQVEGFVVCLECERHQSDGHATGCEIDRLLRGEKRQ